MKVKALNDKIIVTLVEDVAVTPGGIMLAGSITGSLIRGKIISIGPLIKAEESGIKLGDVVAFHKGHGEEVEGKQNVRCVPLHELRYIVE